MYEIQEPTVTVSESGYDEGAETLSHPAYAQIGAYRTQGGGPGLSLYGSDFSHKNTIRITIKASEVKRDLSKDWHHGREQLIEVELSEAQWATFVSTMNVGDGVPCTLRNIQGKCIPLLPPPVKRTEQFRGEVEKHHLDAKAKLDKAVELVAASGLSKAKQKEIMDQIGYAYRDITGNVEFVANSFDKHMEKTVEKAKIEINAYATGVIHRTGLQAIVGDNPLLSLAGNNTKSDAVIDQISEEERDN